MSDTPIWDQMMREAEMKPKFTWDQAKEDEDNFVATLRKFKLLGRNQNTSGTL